MTKRELIDRLRRESNISSVEAQKVIALFFDSMAEGLAGEDRVEIR